MNLRDAVNIMRQIDDEIRVGRKSMMHMSSLGVDAIRHQINELESIREALFNETVVSDRSLENLLLKYRECVRECTHPFYRKKSPGLKIPVPDKWVEELPVTVTAVHLIVYLDISASMFDWGGFQAGGVKRKLVQDFVNGIKKRLDEEKDRGKDIPFKVSLVGYADPTDTAGHNRKGTGKRFWDVVMNKSTDVGGLGNAIGSINRNNWVKGLSQLEEGLTCVYRTIDSLYDGSVVNGKKTENIVLIVSDERQRARDITGSHQNYQLTASTTEFRNKMNNLGIKNIFGLIPFDKGYNYNGYNVNTSNLLRTGLNWNNGIRTLFRSTKEYWNTTNVSQMDNWTRWILDPDSFGQ